MVGQSSSLDFIRPLQNHHLYAKASLFVFIVFPIDGHRYGVESCFHDPDPPEGLLPDRTQLFQPTDAHLPPPDSA